MREKRSLMHSPELRATGDLSTLRGYAAVFNSPTDIGDSFVEIIAPGAFTKALADSEDILALYAHADARLLGRRSNGTLRLSEDDKGLAVEIDLPDTSDGRDVLVLTRRGDLRGMSFSFRATNEQWDETTTPPTRTIFDLDLYEVSAVANPAYADTSLAMRSRENSKDTRQSNADAARARKLASRIKQDLIERNPGEPRR